MATLGQDVRYALRNLRRAPGFAVVAIITLALGIGASTAIFSVIDNILMEPFPYPDAQRFMSVQIHRSEEHTSELQSRSDLVCRLLLEKKKRNRNYYPTHSESVLA